jgi:hypothetical protein
MLADGIRKLTRFARLPVSEAAAPPIEPDGVGSVKILLAGVV